MMHILGKTDARPVLFVYDVEPTWPNYDQHDSTPVQRQADLVSPIARVLCVFVEEDLIVTEYLRKVIAQSNRPGFGIGVPITDEDSCHTPSSLSRKESW
jgi:hypothetical protein